MTAPRRRPVGAQTDRRADHAIVDLFAGPGGLDVAAGQSAVESVGIEFSPDACTTRRAAGLATVQGDVRAYGPADFPDATVLAGGPPCQTFTVSGSGAGRRALDTVLGLAKRLAAREDIAADLAGLDDERTGLVLEPLRWALAAVDAGRPYRAIVLEQVQPVLPVWQACADLLRAEGYGVATGVLRAEQFGVPQTRKRAVLVARLDGIASLPEPTHRAYRRGVPQAAGDPGLLPWVSMGDMLAGTRPDPFVVVSNYGTGGDPRNRGRRLSTEPAATVTGKVNRNRVVGADGTELARLTPGEAGLLQGFPADYPWAGGDVWQQIGNSVPIALGRAVLAAALGGAA